MVSNSNNIINKTTSDLKPLNTNKTIGLGQTQKSGRIKPINGITPLLHNWISNSRGVEILKCSTCPRASHLKKVTCPDKILLVLFLYKHLILINTVAKLNLFILSITSLHKIWNIVLIKLTQTSLPKWSLPKWRPF